VKLSDIAILREAHFPGRIRSRLIDHLKVTGVWDFHHLTPSRATYGVVWYLSWRPRLLGICCTIHLTWFAAARVYLTPFCWIEGVGLLGQLQSRRLTQYHPMVVARTRKKRIQLTLSHGDLNKRHLAASCLLIGRHVTVPSGWTLDYWQT